MNGNGIVGEDSKQECEDLFGRRDFYIGGGEQFFYDPVTETMEWLLKAATSGLKNK